MAEAVVTVLFLVVVSTFCWVMVFRSSARRKFDEPTYAFWRLDAQGRQDWDAMMLAAYLIGAMVFSLITLVFLIVGIYRLTEP